MNGRFDTGLKFFKMFGSRSAFLIRGMMAAILKTAGTTPSLKDALTTSDITSINSSRCCCSKSDGMGSKTHDFGADDMMICLKVL